MDINEARAELIGILKEEIAAIDERLESRRGVIALHNSVVRTSPGLYLVPKGDVYGVGSITSGIVMWSPSDAEIQAAYCRSSAGVAEAVAVPYVTALRDERAACERMLNAHVAKSEA